jgi:hypothetical protein
LVYLPGTQATAAPTAQRRGDEDFHRFIGAQAAAAPAALRLEIKQQEPAAATMIPVWAPNPGVPIIARILAYAFAFLMLLIWALSLTQVRPPDIAPLPDQWSTYRGSQGLTMPYPTGWYTVEDPKDPNKSVLFVLRRGGPVQVNVVPLSIPADAWPQISPDKMDATVETEWVVKGFDGENFALGEGASDPLEKMHAFTFTVPHRQNDVPMSGAWTMRTNGKQIVILLSSSPQEGWTNVKDIFTHIADNLQF